MTRRLLALLILDGALALAVLLSAVADRAPRAPDFRLPALGAVDALDLTRTGQPPVRLIRGPDGWAVGPERAPIDPYALDALRAALAEPVGSDQVVAVDGAALDDYGLGEHAPTVRLEPQGLTLRIGRAVEGRRTFVWPVGAPELYRVRADLRRVFDRPALDWRERRLVPLDVTAIAGLRTTRGGAPDWSAERDDANSPWRLTFPAGLDAGQQEVGAVAAALASARAEGFVASADGFAPALTLTARAFDGRVFEVEIDRPDPSGRVRARAPGQAGLAVIPRHQAVFLDARAADLRARRVFGEAVSAENLDEVVIGGPSPLRVVRLADGRWAMRAPQAVEPLPEGPIRDWLAALAALRAVGFAAKVDPAVFEGAWRVDLRVGDRPVTLEIGAPYGQGARHARTLDRPDRVVILGASALAVLSPDVDALIEAPSAQPPPAR